MKTFVLIVSAFIALVLKIAAWASSTCGFVAAIVLTILEAVGVISIGWFLATLGFWIWVPITAVAIVFVSIVAVCSSEDC